MGVGTSYLTPSLYLLVLGLGIGLLLQVMVLIVQNTAAHHDLGAATSSVNFARQIGSSIGVALIGALFIHRLDGQLDAHLPASGPGHLGAAQVSSITPQGLGHLAAPVRHIIAAAFAQALPPINAYLIPLLAVAFVLALILKGDPAAHSCPPGCCGPRPADALAGPEPPRPARPDPIAGSARRVRAGRLSRWRACRSPAPPPR
jgi:hypothetical protein